MSLMTGAVDDFAQRVEPQLWRRSLALLLDGLRATGRPPLPVGPLDADQADRAMAAMAAGEAMTMSRCTHLDQVEILTSRSSRRLRGVPRARACNGCTCACARPAATSAAATTRPGATRPRTTASTGHPIIRSAEPNEDWSFCYEDDLMFILRSS